MSAAGDDEHAQRGPQHHVDGTISRQHAVDRLAVVPRLALDQPGVVSTTKKPDQPEQRRRPNWRLTSLLRVEPPARDQRQDVPQPAQRDEAR